MMQVLVAVVAVAFAGPVAAVPAEAAPARLAKDQCAQPGNVTADAPWPRSMLAPDSVWRFTRGGGTVVAVLSTGVDATAPQLRGRVLGGYDAVANKNGADSDCTGTGTQVAGVIAAQSSVDNGVVGLAPNTKIEPIRVVADDDSGDAVPQPGPLARGVVWAYQHGVDVIVIATPVGKNDEDVRLAVTEATTRGVVVVAAAGDQGGPDGTDPTPYPAAYPGVLGVGAIGSTGQAWENSQRGDYVDVVAPGEAVPTVQRGGGLVAADGTAIAAGYVGAAAALVRSKRGDLIGAAIGKALIATASPAPLGPAYGAGVVNPYAAVTENAVAVSARPLPAVVGVRPGNDSVARRRKDLALAGAGLAALAVVAALLFAGAARRGRRQSWRPGLAAAPPGAAEPAEPGPPLMLLDEPTESR
jgi:membrane-anchored mycosin MYCP